MMAHPVRGQVSIVRKGRRVLAILAALSLRCTVRVSSASAVPASSAAGGEVGPDVATWHLLYLPPSLPPVPVAVPYGLRSYTPVVGDWNGDGVDTIGAYDNGWWYLRNSNTPGPPDVVVNYGTAYYTPVVGDWNGDGVDTIGAYDNGWWYLRNSNTPGPPDVVVNYGTAYYTPVVGDRNGDGVDTIAPTTTAGGTCVTATRRDLRTSWSTTAPRTTHR